MKTLKLSLLCLGGLLAVSGATFAQGASTGDKPKEALQLKITVPPSGDMLVERDVAEALAYNVREAFRRRGYEGGIEEILMGDPAKDGRPVLVLNLVRWRMGPTGFVDCSFSATLRAPNGTETSLGSFNATDLTMGKQDRLGRERAFENAAQRAADDLWNKLSQLEALPGLIPSKSS